MLLVGSFGMRWNDFKNKLPLRKRWQQNSILLLLAFHILMQTIREIYKDIKYIDFIIYWIYGLFLIIFTVIYLKYPNKFKD
jgi:hypothetical protein